ncbi:glycosyltransferase family 2 protein [bacterium]|nr:glycosyltransferase family 2 protein [bacterium]
MRPKLSIVIPLFNEEQSLRELYKQICESCDTAQIRFETIFIDDGSTDSSFQVLKDMHAEDNRIKIIQFRRNAGKSEALSAGFQEAVGVYVVTMDADLQDDPVEIPALLGKLEQDYDLVSGWKKERKDPVSKRWPSRLFNAVTSGMCGLKIHDFNCGFKIYRSEVIKTLRIYGQLHRYIPALAHLEGFRVTEMAVNHRARKFGHSKYGAGRYANGLFALVTVMFLNNYMRRPLHLFGMWGGVLTFAGFGLTLYLVLMRIFARAFLSNRPVLFIGIMLLVVGVQFISLGLLGEMIARGQADQHQPPVRKKLGF